MAHVKSAAVTADESEANEPFGGGKLWIGQHSADKALLVFDPAEADPRADVLGFYNLTQHRHCSFPRATALQKIKPVTDKGKIAKASEGYAARMALREEHEQSLAEASTERRERQRKILISKHRTYVQALGLTYGGIRGSDEGKRAAGSSRCDDCGIPLDDFLESVCELCSRVLCSCGACGCGKRAGVVKRKAPKPRRAKDKA
ncbi:MAG: hypothetical protein WD766_10045 [Gemmatimonadota bacterium]